MSTYCLKCKRNTKNIDAKMIKTKNGRVTLFIKEQEAKRLLSNIGIRIPLSKVPLLGVI